MTLADRLRKAYEKRDEFGAVYLALEAAKMIEALETEVARLREREAEARGVMESIAAEASVPVHTWRNGINHKKMYKGWRKIATERIDLARAFLAQIGPDLVADETTFLIEGIRGAKLTLWLMGQLENAEAEVKVWQAHAHNAIWTDSEECKLLSEENARLRGALEWYADETNYDMHFVPRECGCCTDDDIPTELDRGERARAALNQKGYDHE